MILSQKIIKCYNANKTPKHKKTQKRDFCLLIFGVFLVFWCLGGEYFVLNQM
jgi:hypothetical protein